MAALNVSDGSYYTIKKVDLLGGTVRPLSDEQGRFIPKRT